MKKLNVLTRMLLLVALLVGSTSVWAGDVIYHWDGSGSSSTGNETGGKASAKGGNSNIVAGSSQKGNWTFKMNKGFSNTYYIEIALDNALKGGERITVGVFRTTSNSDATFGFDFGTTSTQTTNSNLEVLSANGTPTDLIYTVPNGAAGSKIVRLYRSTGSTGVYVSKFIIESKEPTAPAAVEPHTITAIINSDGTCTCTPTSSIIVTSGAVSSTAKYGYSKGLKFESSKGIVTISLPSGAKNAKVDLLNSAAITSLNLGGTNTTVTYTGDADNGYINSISIADSYAGGSFAIKKGGSGSPVIYHITLYYETASDEKITITTTDNMAGWRAFYDATQGYTVDANTKVYKVSKSDVDDEVTMETITGGVPANTPLILKTSAADHKMVLTKANPSVEVGTNLLQVTEENDNLSSGVYRLGYSDADGVGFYPYSVASAAAGIVYLDPNDIQTSGSARGLTMVFEDETDGIISVERIKMNNDSTIYNLAGQKVGADYKGIVIVNGKKMLNK